ncbi:MAG TPA: hypothetical protein VFS08_04500 [Gemmatimonadaceae bacterium]|nr:hypothetical protein [Gemmatimonadaceae bacterium]
MPTPPTPPSVPDASPGRCLNVPDRGVAPGSASRLPRWRAPERPATPPREPTAFPRSECAVPQADGAA